MRLQLRSAWQLMLICSSLLIGINGAYAAGNEISVVSRDTVTPAIELYTSEGCSSCPRADDFISRLGETMDENFHAVPLAFHVDYWNWLGWDDPYSQPKFTARQRDVAAVNKQRSIYTPEIVVAGKETRGGKNIVTQIKRKNDETATVKIKLELKADGEKNIDADLNIEHGTNQNRLEARVAIFENDIVREIKGGENSGKTLHHNYVVRHWSSALSVNPGSFEKMISLMLDEDWVIENLGIAVIVMDRLSGETLQSVSTPIASLFSS